ncbi:PsbP-related protein [Geopsychrobacter electrodiphilus]|uniref:PsbP-related protein n=1 Tax=Geopsychrobacter electrodiphilus TaxID=225196 RepID=UPI00037E3056|nr:PsbP-related protein [Geopsychrobacter electrodiphilus]
MTSKTKKSKTKLSFLIALALVAGMSGYGETGRVWASDNPAASSPRMDSRRSELPVAAEKNPPGDIPDSQVFVPYSSSQAGYRLSVPEGWARTTSEHAVTFQDKLNGLSVTITKADKLPDKRDIYNNQATRLKQTGRAVIMKQIKTVRLSNQPAILMRYESNSEPDPVINKQVRLENSSYFYYHNGKLAELRLWAPLGADNVDQWRLISRSFNWR